MPPSAPSFNVQAIVVLWTMVVLLGLSPAAFGASDRPSGIQAQSTMSGQTSNQKIDNIPTAYLNAKAALTKFIDEYYQKINSGNLKATFDVERNDALEDQLWARAAEWVVEYLDSTPSTGPNAIAAAASAFDHELRVQLLLIGRQTYLVGLSLPGGKSDPRIGSHFVVVALRNGRFTVVRTMPGERNGETKKTEKRAFWSVRNMPSLGSAALLPETAHGEARFSINAEMIKESGMGEDGRITIWKWSGTREILLFEKDYFWIDEVINPEPRLDGRILHIEIASPWRSPSMPLLEIPPADWRIEILPNGIRNLGIFGDR